MKACEIEKQIREEERAEGIRIFIEDNWEEQVPEERILAKLQRRYNLTAENAREHYNQAVKEMTKAIE